MRELQRMAAHELREIKTAAGEAIEAMAWFDLMVEDIKGLRQAGAEWSAAAEVLRKVSAEIVRREKTAERQAS